MIKTLENVLWSKLMVQISEISQAEHALEYK